MGYKGLSAPKLILSEYFTTARGTTLRHTLVTHSQGACSVLFPRSRGKGRPKSCPECQSPTEGGILWTGYLTKSLGYRSGEGVGRRMTDRQMDRAAKFCLPVCLYDGAEMHQPEEHS